MSFFFTGVFTVFRILKRKKEIVWWNRLIWCDSVWLHGSCISIEPILRSSSSDRKKDCDFAQSETCKTQTENEKKKQQISNLIPIHFRSIYIDINSYIMKLQGTLIGFLIHFRMNSAIRSIFLKKTDFTCSRGPWESHLTGQHRLEALHQFFYTCPRFLWSSGLSGWILSWKLMKLDLVIWWFGDFCQPEYNFNQVIWWFFSTWIC